ncbi:MAG TPA: pyridoxamine 5'-phosphate oxidase family protein [Acidimicrobiales bacterium]|nr:pyridoxamine 5'-phosphate oxidase family protein [Acidimicrobiales bacterium]
MTATDLAQTDRSTLRRLKERGTHERTAAEAILDEAIVAHVAVADAPGPLVLPMVFARVDDRLYLHGALANHLLRTATGSAPVCIEVTLVDGLVLARSAFHHSINYRSVVLFGDAELVDDVDEKRAAMVALVEHLVAGRSDGTRLPTDAELRKTAVVRFVIDEGSAKVRTGGPVDDEDDLDLDVWAGVVPVATVFGEPQPDVGRPVDLGVPAHVAARITG